MHVYMCCIDAMMAEANIRMSVSSKVTMSFLTLRLHGN